MAVSKGSNHQELFDGILNGTVETNYALRQKAFADTMAAKVAGLSASVAREVTLPDDSVPNSASLVAQPKGQPSQNKGQRLDDDKGEKDDTDDGVKRGLDGLPLDDDLDDAVKPKKSLAHLSVADQIAAASVPQAQIALKRTMFMSAIIRQSFILPALRDINPDLIIMEHGGQPLQLFNLTPSKDPLDNAVNFRAQSKELLHRLASAKGIIDKMEQLSDVPMEERFRNTERRMFNWAKTRALAQWSMSLSGETLREALEAVYMTRFGDQVAESAVARLKNTVQQKGEPQREYLALFLENMSLCTFIQRQVLYDA